MMQRTTRRTLSKAASKSQPQTQSSAPSNPIYFHHEAELEYGFLAPWYIAPFYDKGRIFTSVGQWMMAAKARLFHDEETLEQILTVEDSEVLKSLGGKVKGFDMAVWEKETFRLAREANYFKFTKQVTKEVAPRDICSRLLATGEQEIVYAAADDRVWGIGFEAVAGAEQLDERRGEWGANEFGKALVAVRGIIRFQQDLSAAKAYDEPGSGFGSTW